MADVPGIPFPQGTNGAFIPAEADPVPPRPTAMFVPSPILFATSDIQPVPAVMLTPREGGDAPPGDVTAPEVIDIAPPAGTILDPEDPISFSVVDDSGSFARILVAMNFAGQAPEFVHDGDVFVGYYSTRSSRTVVPGGWRYTVSRAGGWPSAPSIRIFPIDSSGNDGT